MLKLNTFHLLLMLTMGRPSETTTPNAFTLVVPGPDVPIWSKTTSRTISIRLKSSTETLAAYETAVVDFKAKTTQVLALDVITKNGMAKAVIHVKQIIDQMHMFLNNVNRVISKLTKFTSSRPPPARVPDAQCDLPVPAPLPKEEVMKFAANIDRQMNVLKKAVVKTEAGTEEQDDKDKANLDHLEHFIIAMEVHLNLVKQMSASVEELLQVAGHLSNVAVPDNIIFVLTMKGCLDITANEIVDVESCGAYQDGYNCAVIVSQIDPIGPAYKALAVPYFHLKSGRYWELDPVSYTHLTLPTTPYV